MIIISEYIDKTDREGVIILWESVFGYKDARNKPELVIDKKLDVDDNLFFVAKESGVIKGTIMAGYDGHRGWIYSLAVSENHRSKKIGSKLLYHAEEQLKKLGCLKINLQILNTNKSVMDFYLKNGYKVEERISMGKVID